VPATTPPTHPACNKLSIRGKHSIAGVTWKFGLLPSFDSFAINASTSEWADRAAFEGIESIWYVEFQLSSEMTYLPSNRIIFNHLPLKDFARAALQTAQSSAITLLPLSAALKEHWSQYSPWHGIKSSLVAKLTVLPFSPTFSVCVMTIYHDIRSLWQNVCWFQTILWFLWHTHHL
jgi:hypothetical protein